MEMLIAILPYFTHISEISFVLMLVSTIVVRLTPTKEDDKAIYLINSKLHKFLTWFPTFGKNPRTKALEAAYLALKEEEANAPQSDDAEIAEQLKK